MSLQESVSRSPTIFPTPGNGTAVVPDAGANPGTGIDGEWFYEVAVAVFGKSETGAQLHLATGWPRASCYAFVARDPDQRRRPSTEFLRILFRSEHGAPFHDAFMRGCAARWWLDRERAADVGTAAISEFTRRAAP